MLITYWRGVGVRCLGYQDAVCTVGGGIDWRESCDQLVFGSGKITG